MSLSNGYSAVQSNDTRGKSRAEISQGTYRSSQPLYSYTEKPETPPMEFTTDSFEEDNLNALDIPDMPPSSMSLTDEIIISGRSSYYLMKRPLPANFIVADAIAPFETAKVEGQGRCESKYWSNGDSSKLNQNLKDSSHWDDYSNDPIFLNFPDESKLIPWEDLVNLYNHNHGDDGNEESEEQYQEANEEPKSPQDEEDTRDIMDSLENALSEGRRQGSDSKLSETDTVKSRTNAEEVLASLGVTGAPKPVRAPARPYPPPSVEERARVSSDRGSWSSGRSPSRYDLPAVPNTAHQSSYL